jgi:RimJ/RimL family protein N-acetyltransferase
MNSDFPIRNINLKKINCRNVKEDDFSIIYTWRNLNESYVSTKNTSVLNFHEHLDWSKKRITRNDEEPYYIYELDDTPVAITRLDLVSRHNFEFEISVLVSPDFRGIGVATYCIKMLLGDLGKKHLVYSVKAWVHSSNVNSMKLFKSLGFNEIKDYENGFTLLTLSKI